MSCSMCKYEWCWTCGFDRTNWFHKLTLDGFFCAMMNSWGFGFECNIHWSFRLIITVTMLLLSPVIFYLLSVFGCTALIYRYGCDKGRKLFFCVKRDCPGSQTRCIKVVGIVLALSFLFLIEFCLIFSVAAAVGTIIYALLIVPIVIFEIFFLLRILYQQCLRSKKVDQSEN